MGIAKIKTSKYGVKIGRRIGHSPNKVHWIMDFIRNERVRQELTQDALSVKTNMCNSSVSGYETGHNSIRTIFAIERILNILGYKLKIERISE